MVARANTRTQVAISLMNAGEIPLDSSHQLHLCLKLV